MSTLEIVIACVGMALIMVPVALIGASGGHPRPGKPPNVKR